MLVLGWLSLTIFCVFSQTNRRYGLSLQTDNDSYLMKGQDQYYTNGLVMAFDKPLAKTSVRVDLLRAQLGHQLFNGTEIYGVEDLKWDRPSTGRFFLNAQFQRTYVKDWLWNVKVEISTLGKAGKGEEIQRFIHKKFHMYEVESWESNINSAIGVDLEASVAKTLWRNQANSFEVSTAASGRVGTDFTNLSSQVFFRVGKLAPLSRSYFVGNGGFFSDDMECYFFCSPGYTYQFYNATIQGALFSRRQGQHYSIEKQLFTQTVGIAYSRKRFSIEVGFLFNTKEGREMYSNHQYGRIKGGIRF